MCDTICLPYTDPSWAFWSVVFFKTPGGRMPRIRSRLRGQWGIHWWGLSDVFSAGPWRQKKTWNKWRDQQAQTDYDEWNPRWTCSSLLMLSESGKPWLSRFIMGCFWGHGNRHKPDICIYILYIYILYMIYIYIWYIIYIYILYIIYIYIWVTDKIIVILI